MMDSLPWLKYQWFKNDSLLQDTSHKLLVNQSGSYHLRVKSISGTEFVVAPISVYFYKIALNYQADTNLIQGDSLILIVNGFTNAQYEWTLNGNIIEGATSMMFVAKVKGQYEVKVVQPNSGLYQNASIKLRFIDGVNPTDTVILFGDSVSLNNPVLPNLYYTVYKDGLKLLDSIQHAIVLNKAGIYVVETRSGKIMATSRTFRIDYAKPLLKVEEQDINDQKIAVIYVENVSTDRVIFQWLRDGDLLRNETSNILNTNSHGSYYCKLVNVYNDTVYTDTAIITFTSLPTIAKDEYVKLFLDESTLNIWLSSAQTGRIDISLYDMSGRKVVNFDGEKYNRVFEERKLIGNLKAGIYLVNVRVGEKQMLMKKVIKR
jgi:hypothetical protein